MSSIDLFWDFLRSNQQFAQDTRKLNEESLKDFTTIE